MNLIDWTRTQEIISGFRAAAMSVAAWGGGLGLALGLFAAATARGFGLAEALLMPLVFAGFSLATLAVVQFGILRPIRWLARKLEDFHWVVSIALAVPVAIVTLAYFVYCWPGVWYAERRGLIRRAAA